MSDVKDSVLEKIERKSGRAVPVDGDDIDTDRIIPARYMKGITFEGLEKHVFEDVRTDPDGKPLGHPFDDPRYQGAKVLIVDRNFGCGSSREHAPQCIQRWGIEALVGESFAEIFFGNCTTLGMPAVTLAKEDLAKLKELVKSEPRAEVIVDLKEMAVMCRDQRFPARMPDGARKTLSEGTWDATRTLLVAAPQIRSTAERLPYVSGFGGAAR